MPWELLDRFPTLRKLPRNMRAVLVEWAEVMQSDAFLSEIMDATALLVFPYFGFGGWLEQYTGYCPLYHARHSRLLRERGGPAGVCRMEEAAGGKNRIRT